MSDVPNRAELEAELAKKLGKLFKTQMARLLELMGDPPNMDNVPASFWEESGGEFNSVVIPFLEKQYLDQAARALGEQPVGVDWTLINQRARDWARQYTFDLVSGINQTSRATIQSAIADYFDQGMTIGQLEQTLAPSFGPVRAEMIAVTEVTRASSQGELALSEELQRAGVQMTEIWNTNNDELVCPICAPKNQKPRGDEWSDPPPAHPRCRCWINLELPTKSAKYSGTQPRDENGRWTSGGGGSIPTQMVNAQMINPVNPITDMDKFKHLAVSMEEDGWKGDPVLGYMDGENMQALTGSHRIYAAREAGIDVPVSVIDTSAFSEDDINTFVDLNDDEDRLAFMKDATSRGIIPAEQTAIMGREIEINVRDSDRSYKDNAEKYDRQKKERTKETLLANSKPSQQRDRTGISDYMDRMRQKYGSNPYSAMSDSEIEEMERLERGT